MASETTAQTNAAAPGGAKPQPVAMEIPVTVNGASTVAGSDKRQPFSETTQTVLVFGSGAVIRLAAAVGPGQLLFVTNEKSKQEVVCQVVKTKQNGSAAGYVELKFTEATGDFWGIRAPGSGAVTPPPVAIAAAPTKSLEQKLTDLKAATPAATQPSPVAPIVPPMATEAPPAAHAAAPVAKANETQGAPVVAGQPPATPRVPTLSEFLTQGSNGPELKTREKTQREKPATTAVLTEERPTAVSSGKEQTSSDHDSKPSLSVALGVNQVPAPGSASFDLSADLPAEEVKIPAWLEPLARNSAAAETKALETGPTEGMSEAPHVENSISGVAPLADEARHEQENAPVLSSEGRTPNFGTSLALDSQADAATNSGKGWKIGLAIVALLLAAAAIWYWYVNQPQKVSAGGNGTVAEGNPASLPAPIPNEPAAEPVTGNAPVSQPVASAAESRPGVNGATSGNPVSASLVGAKSTDVSPGVKPPAPSNYSPQASSQPFVEELTKKPALGQVHLAAPKVAHSEAAADNGADPGLALNGAVPADSSSGSLFSSKSKGPAAPLPVGGDVKVARLVSSVPPVYPQMARTQRVSGDVTIDALIDANGRVSTTRVISGPALLHEAAMSAVRQWKYQPATLNGMPTATHLTVTVQFRLQ